MKYLSFLLPVTFCALLFTCSMEAAEDDRLILATSDEIQSFYNFDALLFAHACSEREDVVVRQLCVNLPSNCKKVGLVSYKGMDQVRKAVPTHSWLEEKFVAKWNQEVALESLTDQKIMIWRETVLTFESSSVSTSRANLARTMLDWVVKA